MGFRATQVHGGGITFNPRQSVGVAMQVPCGQCIGCRLERARQWAMRCVHESKMHDSSCMVTLTYDPENIPVGGTLDKKEFPGFMKKLRKELHPQKIRYFHAGEYGEKNRRPHYHALIFGYAFPDRTPWGSKDGNAIFRSRQLEKIWDLGFCTICELNFKTAAYVARYVVDKVTGSRGDEYYQGRVPEFATMSLRPGIGRTWYDKWKKDVYPSDMVVMNGLVMKPPAYYDGILEVEDPLMFAAVKAARTEKRHREDETDERREVIETCTYARLNLRGGRKL